MKIQCDRCKEIYDESVDVEIKYNVDEMGLENEFHICSGCGEQLRNFMKEEE